MFGQTAGPGVGSVDACRCASPHQSFCAATGVAVLSVTPVERRVEDAERVVGDVALRDRRGRRADEADARAEAQVLVVLGVVAERVRVVVRRRREDAADRRVRAVHEVRRDGVAGHLDRGAGGHAHAVLAEERPGRTAAAAGGRRSRRCPTAGSRRRSAAESGSVWPPAVGVVVVLARVAADDLVVDQDAAVRDAGRPSAATVWRRRVVAGRAVDQHADRVVVVDARVVDRQRARRRSAAGCLRFGLTRVTSAMPMPNGLLRKPPGTV